MRDEPHAERGGAARDLLADASQAGESQHLVAHFFAEELLLLPFALLHRGIGRRQMPGQRQHESHRQFRDADAVRAGRVHDHDAACAGRGTSTLSTPVPARAMARRRGAASISAVVTFVALRTTSASAVCEILSEGLGRRGRCVRRSPSLRHAGDRLRRRGRSSATTIFTVCLCSWSTVFSCSLFCLDAKRRLYLWAVRGLTAGQRRETEARDVERVTVAQRWCKPLKRSGSRVAQPCWDQLFNRVSTETVGNCDHRSRDTALTATQMRTQ